MPTPPSGWRSTSSTWDERPVGDTPPEEGIPYTENSYRCGGDSLSLRPRGCHADHLVAAEGGGCRDRQCALPLPRILTATPALWPLPDAQDNCVFKISQDGVLEFNSPNSPPDYDDPGDVGENNVYNVVVQATDGDAGDNASDGTALRRRPSRA